MHPVLSPGAQVGYPKAYGQALSMKTTSPSGYSWEYTDETPITALNMQSSTNSHPQVQDQSNHFYGSPETPRNWNGMGHWMNSGPPVYYEKDSHTQSQLLYGSTHGGRLPSVTSEGVSPLNMTSLHSSLPVPASLGARQLPMPTRGQSISSPSNISSASQASSEQGGGRAHLSSHYSNPDLSSVDYGPGYRNFRGSNWATTGPVSESRRSSLNNQSVSNLMPPPISRPSLSSVSTIPMADVPSTSIGPMGYVSLGMADTNEGPTTPAGLALNYSSSSPSHSYTSLGSFNTRSSAPTFTSGLSTLPSAHNSLLSRSGSSPPRATSTTLYSYSADTGSKSDGSDQDAGASGTLVSGQRYAPLQQLPSRRSSTTDDLHENDFSRGGQRKAFDHLISGHLITRH